MFTDLIVKLFIKRPDQVDDPVVRSHYNNLSGITGIIINLLLAGSKATIGWLVGSVSIMGDAVNNFSDCASSLVSMISMKMAIRPADKKHPFGHARIEYLASTFLAAVIIFIGFQVGRSSIEKIITPEITGFNAAVVVVLVLSILAKVFLFFFNRKLGQRIDSLLLKAVATDSLSDCLSTSAVLIAAIIAAVFHIQLDGYMGVLVALFILYSGFSIMKEMIDRYLGACPPQELSEKIKEFVMKHDDVKGMHDLVIHDYGPGRTFASAHVEMDAAENIMDTHDTVDLIEREIREELGIQMVIHMDPIVLNDPYVNRLREMTKKVLDEFEPPMEFHDFRVVRGRTHTNVIFDVLLEPDSDWESDFLRRVIQNRLRNLSGEMIYVVLTVDRSYVAYPVNKL